MGSKTIMREVVFHTFAARRFPDPFNLENNTKVEHHVLLCEAKRMPEDVPLDPNPRDQNTNKAIYKDVRESLLEGSDLTFHLKNKGITILANRVSFDESKSIAKVTFNEGEGIADGGHTYKIIKENLEEIPDGQFVKVEVLTGLPKYLVEPIARGLNTAVQVSDMSLDNLNKKFDWIKEELSGTDYANEIAFRDNDAKPFTARDIVALLTLFNIELFPETSTAHPKIAYTSKAECLRRFGNSEDSYRKLRPLLLDILKLHDYVQLKTPDLYNEKYGGKGRRLAFFQNRKRGMYNYIFIGRTGKTRMADGALYPILGAFRFLVEDKGTHFGWKLGSFDKVQDFVDKVGAELIMATKNTSDSRDKNPNAIGKDDTHWQNLYKTVALEYLMPS